VDEVSPDFIVDGEYLDYLIRFQNTGNDTAFTVVVTDTLQASLQWETFELIAASHDMTMQRNDSLLIFRFDDILLVDSVTNEPESHGFIRFKIKPQGDLVVGETVEGEANIYFDYNAPVITNNMITTVVDQVTSTEGDEINVFDLSLYPNPTSDEVYFEGGESFRWVLRDANGIELSNGDSNVINLRSYDAGIYFVTVEGTTYRLLRK
jgi:uncharacterized repeat protein (TIGR01451 family)